MALKICRNWAAESAGTSVTRVTCSSTPGWRSAGTGMSSLENLFASHTQPPCAAEYSTSLPICETHVPNFPKPPQSVFSEGSAVSARWATIAPTTGPGADRTKSSTSRMAGELALAFALEAAGACGCFGDATAWMGSTVVPLRMATKSCDSTTWSAISR